MSDQMNLPSVGEGNRKGLFATLGMSGAMLAASCCILPLALVTLGISGAWIVNLTALTPYSPYFGAAALVFIGLAFWQVYFQSKPACEAGTYCARPQSARLIKAVLWAASVLVVLALSVNWWAPLFY